MNKKGYLILEDSKVFEGLHLNSHLGIGEVVFNTSHSGYEEMASDPSYFKQILVTTAPMQGNYGVDSNFRESEKLNISGFICLEMQNTKRDSSWLKALSESEVPVLSEVDTRSLSLHLRDKGAIWGGVFESSDVQFALDEIKKVKEKYSNLDWTELLSVKSKYSIEGKIQNNLHVGVLDFGCKKNIIRELKKRFEKITIYPSKTKAEEILSDKVNGLLLSNGPGDPQNVNEPIKEIESLLGKIPIMGICMGNQVLGRALGVETFKLKFGHRGANHPILDIESGQIYMSSQNHGYALNKEQLKEKNIKITHKNLNDNTVAGIKIDNLNAFAVQFHPESHPGPHEAVYLFDDFVNNITKTDKEADVLSFFKSKKEEPKVFELSLSEAHEQAFDYFQKEQPALVEKAKNKFVQLTGPFDEEHEYFEAKLDDFRSWFLFFYGQKKFENLSLIKNDRKNIDVYDYLTTGIFSLFVVVKIKDDYIFVKDLLSKITYQAKDSVLAITLTKGDFIQTSLYYSGQNLYEFGLSVIIHPEESGSYILKKIKTLKKKADLSFEQVFESLIAMRYQFFKYKQLEVRQIYTDKSKLFDKAR